MKKDTEKDDRKKFLLDYTQLDNRLHELGFKCVKTNTPADYHYSHYNKIIDDLYGVEHFVNETLNLSIRFLRDRHEHKIMMVGTVMQAGNVYTLKEADLCITHWVKDQKTELLEKLNLIKI